MLVHNPERTPIKYLNLHQRTDLMTNQILLHLFPEFLLVANENGNIFSYFQNQLFSASSSYFIHHDLKPHLR